MIGKIKEFTEDFLREIKDKKIHIISHYDTDGIISAAIIAKTLGKINQQFSIKILKQLDKKEIDLFPENKIILLLDLGSSSFEYLSQLKNKIFMIDHHEISDKSKISENIRIVNPHLLANYEELCASELCYLVSKQISEENKNFAYLSLIGMIGDTMERNINKTRDSIIKDSDITIKKGFLIYPSTRPLDKSIEFSSSPFIPGATGDHLGALDLLKEAGIERVGKNYKSLIDLTEKEMEALTTAISLRLSNSSHYIGNLYVIKFFNRMEDARELSAIINACSRMDHSNIALMMCMGNSEARKKADRMYIKYRQHIISGLKYIDKNSKILGSQYVIINAKDKVKDTIIGTLASILSFSSVYKEGTIIVAMAYNQDKIKVSTRMTGKNPQNSRNLKELMDSITGVIGGESGGHHYAAGCTIDKKHEEEFIDLIKKKLDLELVRIN